jgi:hypothetical protein
MVYEYPWYVIGYKLNYWCPVMWSTQNKQRLLPCTALTNPSAQRRRVVWDLRFLQRWRWRQHVPPVRWCVPTIYYNPEDQHRDALSFFEVWTEFLNITEINFIRRASGKSLGTSQQHNAVFPPEIASLSWRGLRSSPIRVWRWLFSGCSTVHSGRYSPDCLHH